MGYMIPITAGAAAALMAEEERMAVYTDEDLEGDWEFKIVRANTPVFRKPALLRQLVEEEAVAGWVIVEKFDDSRVRFKRRRDAGAQDAFLPKGVDAYRSTYGSATLAYAGVAVMLGLLVATGLLILILAMAR